VTPASSIPPLSSFAFPAKHGYKLHLPAGGIRRRSIALAREIDIPLIPLIVSVMWRTMKTGVLFLISPFEEAAAFAAAKRAFCHIRTLGPDPWHTSKSMLKTSGVDFLSCPAHKLHAPNARPALLKRRLKYHPYINRGAR